MRAGHEGITASVMAKLNRRARDLQVETSEMLVRFVVERFLYRLGRSVHASRFLLKGATLMPLWLGDRARSTRDADLAGFGEMTADILTGIARDVFSLDVEPDGVVFDSTSIRVSQIREGDEYGGYRIQAVAWIGRSRIPLQVDVGIGDAVSPAPELVQLPPLLDFEAPRLRAYRPETSIAEKFSAIVTLGTANSRMKDYYDIDRLSAELAFDAVTLRGAIEQTFTRRRYELPTVVPIGLSDPFAESLDKQKQWVAFTRKLARESSAFVEVVARLRAFLMPLVRDTVSTWPPGGPWVS